MPFKDLRHPPIQLGLLQQCLARAAISARSHSLELAFMDHVHRHAPAGSGESKLGVGDYLQIATRDYIVQLGDWIFCVPPFNETPRDDDGYLRVAREHGVTEESIAIARRMKACVPRFLEESATEILAGGPRIVGFSTVFQQNVASLALAKILKSRDASLTVVFGGGNCDGPMGQALHESYPWVDIVVRGEGEQAMVDIAEDVLAGRPVRERPGLCLRRDGASVSIATARAPQVAMGEVPSPTYDEYFARLARSPLASDLLPEVAILFESSRGCWWGQKSHCTFCGLNSELMAFRSKAPATVVRELIDLAERYKVLDFVAVDDIIDLRHVRELLPLISASGYDFSIFYETKSNLSKAQLRTFRQAGVDAIQPGVESLSTPILRLMRKGVTGLQNIRLLKWCAELGITPSWNLLYGFPREPEAEYARMAALIPALVHLEPPAFMPVQVQRFSPYFDRPMEFGLVLAGPEPYYRYLYDVPEAILCNLAYDFEHGYQDGRDPHTYTGAVAAAVKRWRELAVSARGTLSYRRGPGFLMVNDRRPGFEPADYRFEGAEALIYLRCDEGASAATLHASLIESGHREFDEDQIEEYLDELCAQWLVLREGKVFLSLATAAPSVAIAEGDALVSHDEARQLKRA
jgi:ribosomal peptide maturation radical SAM protein 1